MATRKRAPGDADAGGDAGQTDRTPTRRRPHGGPKTGEEGWKVCTEHCSVCVPQRCCERCSVVSLLRDRLPNLPGASASATVPASTAAACVGAGGAGLDYIFPPAHRRTPPGRQLIHCLGPDVLASVRRST